jgi:hypothetical protein
MEGAAVKHNAINLVKFKTLSMRLKLPLWQCVGLLESIWLFCQHNARDGVLTKFTTLEIAAWLGFEGDADDAIEALVSTRWLDRAADGSLSVHDWDDHRPNWLKGNEARWQKQQPSTVPSSLLSTELSTEPSSVLSTELGTVPPNQTRPDQTRPDPTRPNENKPQDSARAVAKATTTNGSTRMTPPTVEQIAAYCQERENGIDAEEFFAFYESKGWRVGNGPMRSWRAAMQTWEKRRKREAEQHTPRLPTAREDAEWRP